MVNTFGLTGVDYQGFKLQMLTMILFWKLLAKGITPWRGILGPLKTLMARRLKSKATNFCLSSNVCKYLIILYLG